LITNSHFKVQIIWAITFERLLHSIHIFARICVQRRRQGFGSIIDLTLRDHFFRHWELINVICLQFPFLQRNLILKSLKSFGNGHSHSWPLTLLILTQVHDSLVVVFFPPLVIKIKTNYLQVLASRRIDQ